MHPMKKLSFVLLLFLLNINTLTCSAQPTQVAVSNQKTLPNRCLGTEPLNAARAIVKDHHYFYSENPKNFSAILSPKFLRLLEKNYQCSQEGVCALEADPWTDAQDGEAVPPYRFTTISRSAHHSVVRVSFNFNNGPSSSRKTVLLSFERASAKSCWVLTNFKSPSGHALSEVIEKYFSH